MKLTEIAIKRPSFMTMIFTALAVMGIFSYSQMGVDLLPNMEFPWVMTAVVYPGAGPNEVETQIAKPIEEALSSVNNLKSIRSYSSENTAVVLCEFQMSTDVNIALSDVDRKMNEIKINLPKEILQPQVMKFNMNSMPIVRIAATSNLGTEEFFQLMKDKIKPRIEQAEGVTKVDLVGGKEREIRVEIDNDKLKSYNLSVTDVTALINAENMDFPTGKVEETEKNYTVRIAGKFKDLETIRNLKVASTPTGVIRIRDIANVLDTYKEKFSFSRLNGESGMGVIVSKASDANAIQTADKVKKVVEQLQKQYAEYNLKFVISQDTTTFTKESLSDVQRDLMLAIIMVAVVLFIFLHDIKSSLIVLLSIPTSMISAFIFMNIFGFTVNLITLMALTLVIGILVDDSIVVLENIHRHLEVGEDPKRAALNGRNEIGMAAVAITLVDVVVFLPIAMVGGIVGKIFREFGLTVVVATLFSLFVSFTLTPMLASKWARVIKYTKESWLSRFFGAFDRFEKNLSNGYRNMLAWGLEHRKSVVGVSFGLLVLSFVFLGAGLVGTEFMPSMDRGEFAIDIEMPLGTAIEKTDNAVAEFEKFIAKDPDIERYYTTVGRTENGWGDMSRSHLGQINIKLKDDKKRSTQEHINECLDKAYTIPGVKATASMIGMMGVADEAPVMIEIKGDNLDDIIPASEKVKAIVEKTKGTRDVKTSWEEGQPEIQVHLDRTKCYDKMLNVGIVGATLRNALEGDDNSKFKEGDTEYDLRILLDKKNRENPADVANIIIKNPMGQQVKLSEVADVQYGSGPSQIQRKDKSRVITITSNLDDTRPLGEIADEIKLEINKLNLSKEVSVNFAGSAEDMGTMFTDMLLAIFFAILFMFMIMVSLYESYSKPFIIMFSLPVALFGAFTGLMLFNLNLNIFSMIGILMSVGLVTKNAILLVDYTNTLRNRGMSLKEALLEAGPIRLRPIIMTTTTMIIGMMPLAVMASGAGDMRQGLAVVVMGALLSSTLLTLLLVPVMYVIFENFRTKLSKRFGKGKKQDNTEAMQLPLEV